MKPLMCLLIFSLSAAAAPPVGRDVDIIASDGTRLKATYVATARPGPAVLLMHMCITTRTAWEPVAQQLGAAAEVAVSARLPAGRIAIPAATDARSECQRTGPRLTKAER